MTPHRAGEILGMSQLLIMAAELGILQRRVIEDHFDQAIAHEVLLDSLGYPVARNEIDRALALLIAIHDRPHGERPVNESLT